MIILYITLVLIFLLIIFKLIKEHTHVLPQEVYAIEKYFSIFKKEYIYRISKPEKIFFAFSKPQFVKYVIIPPTTHFFCEALLKDYTKCDIQINYKIEQKNTQKHLKNIYDACPVVRPEKKATKIEDILYLEGELCNFLFFYDPTDLNTIEGSERFRDEIKEKIKNVCDNFFEINIIGLGIKIKYIKTFEKEIKMDIESLSQSNYNMQQINQILKAYEEGIILNNIQPIVPEYIMRTIREKYKNNKEKINDFIKQLSIKTKTQEEISEICKKIVSL